MKVNFIKDLNPKTGKENMETDLKLLEDAIESQSKDLTLRLYTWAPRCVSFGRNQREARLGVKETDTVIRPTGGRALLHDKELTYSVVCPIKPGSSIIESYMEISDALIEGFKHLGIPLEYAGKKSDNLKYCMNISCGADVSYKGKKLIGSAQYRTRGYLLQHGSILYEADFDFLEKLFMEKIDKNSIITLKEINPNITTEQLSEAIYNGFKTKFEH